MDRWIQLSPLQLRLTFAASCIEWAAARRGVSSPAMARRFDRVHLVDDFIMPCYEQLHTLSREHATDDVLSYLDRREEEDAATSCRALGQATPARDDTAAHPPMEADATRSPLVQRIIVSTRVGLIADELTRRLPISPAQALTRFYQSQTYAQLVDHTTGLYLQSDLYVVDEFLAEQDK